MAAFRAEFAKSKHVVILTGAGVSAESGVPTFRGAGGFWRKWQATVRQSLWCTVADWVECLPCDLESMGSSLLGLGNGNCTFI